MHPAAQQIDSFLCHFEDARLIYPCRVMQLDVLDTTTGIVVHANYIGAACYSTLYATDDSFKHWYHKSPDGLLDNLADVPRTSENAIAAVPRVASQTQLYGVAPNCSGASTVQQVFGASSSHSTLSSGAIAGVVCGAVLAGFIAFIVGLVALRRHSRRRRGDATEAAVRLLLMATYTLWFVGLQQAPCRAETQMGLSLTCRRCPTASTAAPPRPLQNPSDLC